MNRIKSNKIILKDQIFDGYIYFDGGEITSVTNEELPFDVEYNFDGKYVSPGFIDIHTHGGGGFPFDGSVDDVVKAADFHLLHGTTSIVPTISAAPFEVMKKAAQNIKKAIDISNDIAPEHLEICLDNPFDYLDSIKNAGSVFLGKNCPEALGDYYSGTNHTLPTSGTAKFSSPLSVDDFVKKMQYTYYTKEALANVAEDVEYFAKKEGLTAHAKSAIIRTKD